MPVNPATVIEAINGGVQFLLQVLQSWSDNAAVTRDIECLVDALQGIKEKLEETDARILKQPTVQDVQTSLLTVLRSITHGLYPPNFTREDKIRLWHKNAENISGLSVDLHQAIDRENGGGNYDLAVACSHPPPALVSVSDDRRRYGDDHYARMSTSGGTERLRVTHTSFKHSVTDYEVLPHYNKPRRKRVN